MKAHRQQILNEITKCSPQAKALFAFFCAERLRGCCWAYQTKSGSNLEAYFKWIDILFEKLVNRNFDDKLAIEAAFQELKVIVPKGGEPLAVQAQSGVICLLTAFDALANGKQTTIADAINSTLEAAYNYYCYVKKRIKNDASVPTDFAFLNREANRQLLDVAFVKRCELSTKSDFVEYRVENLQHAILPAV